MSPIDEAHPLQGQVALLCPSKIRGGTVGAKASIEVSTARHDRSPVQYVWPSPIDARDRPHIITQALHGTAVRVGSTQPTRDLVFVSDTAAGFVSIAGSDRTSGEVINLGTGREVSVAELVNKLRP